MKTTTDKLASFISSTRFDALPNEVIHQSKLMFLDVIGCAFSGINHDRGIISRKVIEKFGGNHEASIIGSEAKSACVFAAYVNANMASSLDNEETINNGAHITSSTVFPSLALAERDNLSGKDLITAIAVGYEVACRIGFSTGYPRRTVKGKPVHHIVGTASWESMGSVVSSGNLLRLDQKEMVHALGLQANFAPMPTLQNWAQSDILPLVKYWDSGWMAIGGIMSALLAKEGYTSYPKGIFDGDLGFWKVYGAESCDFQVMTDDLGKKWWLMEASFKPWPCCRIIHHSLTAFDRLITKYKIKPEEIAKITVKGFFYLPHFFVTDPKGAIGSQFSVPHALAMLIFRVPPGPQWHALENVEDEKVKEFRKKVKVEVDDRMDDYIKPQLLEKPRILKRIPTTVEIVTRDKAFSEQVEYAMGDPWSDEFKLNDDDIKNKFRNNTSSYMPMSYKWRNTIEEIINGCLNLEKISNINELTKFFN